MPGNFGQADAIYRGDELFLIEISSSLGNRNLWQWIGSLKDQAEPNAARLIPDGAHPGYH